MNFKNDELFTIVLSIFRKTFSKYAVVSSKSVENLKTGIMRFRVENVHLHSSVVVVNCHAIFPKHGHDILPERSRDSNLS